MKKRTCISYSGRIDLHEMTQAEAFEALQTFFAYHIEKQSRVLLVITGRSGVLKENAPRWLEVNPLFSSHILRIEINPNQGSYSVWLKKNQS